MAAASPVIFCCNTGPLVGIGHLMRCREMARHLQGQGIASVMFGPATAVRGDVDRSLFIQWHAEESTDTVARARQLVRLAGSLGADRVVVDDYRADIAFQQVLADAGLHWIQQFDASLDWSYLAPVLVNANPWERAEHYAGRLLHPAPRLLFGPRYAVIRPEFHAVTPQAPQRAVRRILLAFGGGDDRGLVLRALDALDAPPPALQGVRIEIVSGRGNPGLAAIQARLHTLAPGQATLHVEPAHLPALVAGCDLGLIAGGTMSYELAICGVPPVFVALASNQINPCRGWQALTGAPYLGTVSEVDAAQMRDTLARLAADTALRATLAERGRAAVDGLGTARLVQALMETTTA